MYSMVLMAAMVPAGDTAGFGKHRGGCDGAGCHGAVATSYAGCHGAAAGCHGGGFMGHKDRGGCHGGGHRASAGCHGGGFLGGLGKHRSAGCHGMNR